MDAGVWGEMLVFVEDAGRSGLRSALLCLATGGVVRSRAGSLPSPHESLVKGAAPLRRSPAQSETLLQFQMEGRRHGYTKNKKIKVG